MRSPVHRLADRARAIRRAASRRFVPLHSGSGTKVGASRRSKTVDSVLMKTAGRQIHLLQWDRIEAVVARHGSAIRELASNREVVKDPRFCQTLWVWAAAGADISHTIVSIRSVEATAKRLTDSEHLRTWNEQQARNHVAYRLGLLLSALYHHRLSHTFVRFPDFVSEPEGLFDALQFPRPVERDTFLEVFNAIRDPDVAHIWK
jgi:hypothetical protein